MNNGNHRWRVLYVPDDRYPNSPWALIHRFAHEKEPDDLTF